MRIEELIVNTFLLTNLTIVSVHKRGDGFLTDFYKNFCDICAEYAVTPSHVASQIGLSNAAASGWKKGKQPSDVTLAKLSQYFNVPVSVLTGEQKEKPSTVSGEEHSYTDLQLLAAIKRADEKDLKAIRVILGIE